MRRRRPADQSVNKVMNASPSLLPPPRPPLGCPGSGAGFAADVVGGDGAITQHDVCDAFAVGRGLVLVFVLPSRCMYFNNKKVT